MLRKDKERYYADTLDSWLHMCSAGEGEGEGRGDIEIWCLRWSRGVYRRDFREKNAERNIK